MNETSAATPGPEERPIVRIRNLRKSFGDLDVLKGIDLDVHRGEVVVVLGPSGSGKSTMLRCVNLLEVPTSGQIFFEDTEVTAPDVDINAVRAKLGMVFQSFNLFPHLSAKRNVMIAQQRVLKRSAEEAERVALEQLARVGLAERVDYMPSQLSGGQQQRVAIARALASQNPVILADEPTGNLDEETAGEITAVLKDAAKSYNRCVVIVSHSREVANEADVVFELKGGKIREQSNA